MITANWKKRLLPDILPICSHQLVFLLFLHFKLPITPKNIFLPKKYNLHISGKNAGKLFVFIWNLDFYKSSKHDQAPELIKGV